MHASGVNVGRVADTNLDVEWGGDADHLGSFVMTDKAAEVVGGFDVVVERQVNHLANGGQVREGKIGGGVIGVGAHLLKQANGYRITGAHLDGNLQDQVNG